MSHGPWSPSSTRDFMACPQLWLNKRHGAPERARVFHPGLLAGTAFHRGMEAYLSGGNPQEAVEVSVARDWPQEGTEGFPRDKVLSTVLMGLHRGYEALDLKPTGVLGLEVRLSGPEEEALRHGRYAGTSDLVEELEDGSLGVWDYKTHWSRDARYSDPDLRETQRSWQLRQYAYFAQGYYEKPVSMVSKLLVYFAPVLKVWTVSYRVTQEQLTAWYAQAQEVWYQMDGMAGYGPHKPPQPWQNEGSCERYGWQWRCSYYDTCWEGAV